MYAVMRGRSTQRWGQPVVPHANEAAALRTRKVLCTVLLFMLLWESTGYRYMRMQQQHGTQRGRAAMLQGLRDAAMDGDPLMGRGAANAGLSDAHYIDNHGGVPVGLDGAALAPICAQHGLAPRAWILPRPAPTNASTSNRTTRPLLTAGQHAVRPPRVFDCALLTTASAEVLELRMHELDSVVDRFVVRASPH